MKEWERKAKEEKGLALRDQFAMAALTGLISRGPLAHNLHIDHKEGRSEFVLNACSDAYWIADAMIAAR